MLAILLPRVSNKMARMFMTVRRMMMAHMQKRRKRIRLVPLKDQDLVYSPKLRQLRDFQEPLGLSSMFVMPSMVEKVGDFKCYEIEAVKAWVCLSQDGMDGLESSGNWQ